MKAWILVYVLIFVAGLQHYINWQSTGFLLGLVALPLTMVVDKNRRGSFRFFFLSAGLFLLYSLIPVQTFFFLSLMTAGLFCIETFYGRVNTLPLLVLCCMAPVFDYAMNAFTFPVRLQLTAMAGVMLKTAGIPATVEGNMILCHGNEYAVDPACMGLQMMVTATMCGLILIGHYQQKYQRTLSFLSLSGLLILITVLNIVSNLLRIVSLVHFNLLPGTAMHEVMGILCLIVYVLLPAFYITGFVVKKLGKEAKRAKPIYRIVPVTRLYISNLLLTLCMCYGAWSNLNHQESPVLAPVVKAPAGYVVKPLPHHVYQLMNGRQLVYIKQIPQCFYTEHHPMICWKGSGFAFERVTEKILDGKKVYTAQLVHNKTRLYTAWWYDNGNKSTISQIDWRWDVLRGAHPYSLVNVTSTDAVQLEKEIIRVRQQQTFQGLL